MKTRKDLTWTPTLAQERDLRAVADRVCLDGDLAGGFLLHRLLDLFANARAAGDQRSRRDAHALLQSFTAPARIWLVLWRSLNP